MGIMNTAKHLAVLKAQAKKFEPAQKKTFFLVYDRKSKDSILHIDAKSAPGKFKTPKIIQQRLLKAKTLNPHEYDAFFKRASLVSTAGSVEALGAQKTLNFTLLTGKATDAEMRLALKSFRFIKKPVINADMAEPEAADEGAAGVARAEAALSGGVTAAQLAAAPYAVFTSVDDMIEALAGVEEALLDPGLSAARRAELEGMRDVLAEARDTLDEWSEPSEGGTLGLLDGIDELLLQAELEEAGKDLIAEVLEELRGAWEGLVADVTATLEEVLELARRDAVPLLADDQDPEGLRSLTAADLLSTLLAEMPPMVLELLRDAPDQIELNPERIDAVREELVAFHIGMLSPSLRLIDTELGLGLAEKLGAVIGQIKTRLAGLQAQLR